MSTTLKALYEIINNRLQDFIDSGECPHTRVFYENDDNNSEILNANIVDIDTINNIIKIENNTNMSLYVQGIVLTNRKITNGRESIYIEEHLEETGFVSHDRLKVSVDDINKFSIGDSVSLEIPNSIYLKSEILNLNNRSYANTSFYKTESFILSCEIRTRDDNNSFELEDITDCLKDIFEDYYDNIPIGNDKYVRILDKMKIFDDLEDGTVLQKRTVKIMLGYNVINIKYIR